MEFGDKNHDFTWAGTTLAPGDRFASGKSSENGVMYQLPTLPKASRDDTAAVSPARLNVLGIAWIDNKGTVLGFTPASEWKGPNDFASVVSD